MDSQITAAARALSAGDVLGALKRVSLRDDAPGLALRGICMARLGDFGRSRELLRKATQRFGQREAVARARCIVAEAEVALASRDLRGGGEKLEEAIRTLQARGDRANALHARCVTVRGHLLVGRIAEAERALDALDFAGAPPVLVATGELLRAELSVRALRSKAAHAALLRAEKAARLAEVPALLAEILAARQALAMPAARRIAGGKEEPLLLSGVEKLLASRAFVVDAHRNAVRAANGTIALARRPVLFALLRILAEAWPADASRNDLILRAFGSSRPNDSHRARLRVEIGRLRHALRGHADIRATVRGFELTTPSNLEVVILARPVEDEHARILALLADGESWSSSALALALGASQRTVQRALLSLEREERARSFGRARALRWVSPPPAGFTTTLLLPGPLPVD